MGKQSELIITKGQEFKIVVKDSIKEDDVFIDQYEQAAGMLNTIVAESIAAGERAEKSVKALYSLNEYENNIIAFCGERGEGKSSAMLTFINSLYTNLPKTLQGDDKFYAGYPELRKVHFSAPIIIDPSQFDDVHNILDIILAKIYRNFDRIYEENNRCVDEYDVNRLQNQFQKVYREVSMINNQSKMLDDEFDYEGNIGKLSKLGESTDLKEDLQELIKQYLAFIKRCSHRENEKERLIIAIDDLDLCNSNAYKMAEQIRKYLIIPQIIIIMAVKIEQLELCVEENTIAEFKGVVSTAKQQDEEKQNRIGVEIQGMSERYVAKLIPKARRIYLPKAQSIEDIRVIYKEKDTEEKKGTVIWESETNENLVKAVLDLIRERTGMIFLPEKSGMSYLLPDNLRDMVNWIVFIADMKKVCTSQKEDKSKNDLDDAKIQEIYLKNIRSFIQYFNGEWITRQVPGEFGNELRSMEKMDNFHMNMNAEWLLRKVFDELEKKEEYQENNIDSDKKDSFWKIMQWILRFQEVVYDYEAEQIVYGLKTLYTMKMNQWLREKNKEKISHLIGGYIWGGEFTQIFPKVEKYSIDRNRFEMNTLDAIQVIDDLLGTQFKEYINSKSKRLTVSNISYNEYERPSEIYTLIILAMFTNSFSKSVKMTTNNRIRSIKVLESNKLIADNRQMRKQVEISLENYIVNLMNLDALIDKMNLEELGVPGDVAHEIISEIMKQNKKTIEFVDKIVTNIDVASDVLIYCQNNGKYRGGSRDRVNLIERQVEQFFDNINFFMKRSRKERRDGLLSRIKIGNEEISVAQLYAAWIEKKIERIEFEKERDIDNKAGEMREYREKLERNPFDYKEIKIEEFLSSFRGDKTAEELKVELEKMANDICRYRGKHKEAPKGLDINELCNLYEDTLSLYYEGENMPITSDMKERYNFYAKGLKKIVVIHEQEEEN